MRPNFILSLIILVSFSSCRHRVRQGNNHPETPKALDPPGSFQVDVKRSNGRDLVSGIYSELTDKNPALKEVEKDIDDLNESFGDSTEMFNSFNDKNVSYYNYANMHVRKIKDSVLRDKMKALVDGSLSKYNLGVETDTKWLAEIDKKNLHLGDLHIMLKLLQTLPVMEKYQANEKPSVKSLTGFARQIDKVTLKMDSLLKK